MNTTNTMKHLAIIADGNRRWARANDLPVKTGYIQGLITIENCCDWAIKNNIEYLTVFCFSTENWNRPKEEVDLLMDLARWYFDYQREWYISRGIRVKFAGRRDRFDQDFRDIITRMEQDTATGQYLTITICIDYGGRSEIARAVYCGARTEEEIAAFVSRGLPDPDAILRTGGEYRLSNFLLWQSAYSELLFTKTYFPDLNDTVLNELLDEYHSRKRNYGK